MNAGSLRIPYRGAMPAATSSTTRERLRAGTSAAHAGVDAFFGSGLRSIGDYRAYLLGLHALVRDADAALVVAPLSAPWRAWRHPAREAWLRQDLAWHGLEPLRAAPALALGGDAAAAGCLYVIEGSALGARLLLRDVGPLGFDADAGASFLHRHAGEGTARRWRDFTAMLEAAGFDAAADRAMLDAAAATFTRAGAEFRRGRLHAGATPPSTA